MLTHSTSSEAEQIPLDVTVFSRSGWLIILAGLLSFTFWSLFAPLDKGVTSSGTVMVSGHRKTVQAPAGGIIDFINVKEGERVKAGDKLVQLDQTQAQAQLKAVSEQHFTSLAMMNRLRAERDGLKKIPELQAEALPGDPAAAADILQLQEQIFHSRRDALHHETEGYQRVILGIHAQIKGLLASAKSKKVQLDLLNKQINGVKSLVEEGYFPRNRYLELLRQAAEIESSLSEMAGQAGQLQKQREEYQLRIEKSHADYQKQVRTELEQAQLQLSEYKNKLEQAMQAAKNTIIYAPQDGVVLDLNLFTKGGVITYGEKIMDIVPDRAELVVEAQLGVELIDKVHIGLPVKLLFTAFNQSTTPKIPATVTLVSADRLVDSGTGAPFYKIQATVSPEQSSSLQNYKIRPGMAVELFIQTGNRSLFSYLFKPFIDRAATALSEE